MWLASRCGFCGMPVVFEDVGSDNLGADFELKLVELCELSSEDVIFPLKPFAHL